MINPFPSTWDYVVVGGGSAGCVVANRLSEGSAATVLLLEAGGEAKGFAIRVPALIQKLSNKANWLYPVEPDGSRNGTADPYNSGRVLGGSSSTNAMMWVRGNPADYDRWASLGCVGWGYDSVLPYFRRAERFEDGDNVYRGGGGPQRVARMRVPHRMTDVFLRAATQAGFEALEDYNAGRQVGVGLSQVSQRRGLRHTAADAYLTPVRNRPNLTVETDASARRVVLDGARAVGVEYRVGGETTIAGARREVILCAGAIGSPKLLMLSGIGPRATLSRFGIPVVVDRPDVGQNLQDHPGTSLVFEVTERTLNQDLRPSRLLHHALTFVIHGGGAITSTANHAVAFGAFDAESTVPDMQLIFVAYGLSHVSSDEPAERKLRQVLARSGGRSEGRGRAAMDSLVTMHTVILHPRSRGEVSLRSADAADPPVVRHELLGDGADLHALTRACRRVREIFSTPAILPYVVGERSPGEKVTSDACWEEYLRNSTFRLHHGASTCRMGVDQLAVGSTNTTGMSRAVRSW
jgi:choline dehydrogenase